jgi:hypothetical protein
MDLLDTPCCAYSADFVEVRRIAERGRDHPAPMPNMNRYTSDSGFPDRGAYRDGLEPFLIGAELLWPSPVFGEAVGDPKINESSPVGIHCIGLSSGSMTPRISVARAGASNKRISIAARAISRHSPPQPPNLV